MKLASGGKISSPLTDTSPSVLSIKTSTAAEKAYGA